MTPDLSILKEKRDALILAEMAAWLHDMGKCSDEFLKKDGMGFDAKCNSRPRVNPHKAIFSPEELTKLPFWSKLSQGRGQPTRKEEAEHDTALWKTLNYLQIDNKTLDREIKIDKIGCSYIRELILWGRPIVSDNFQSFKEILNDAAYLAAYLGRCHQASHIEKEEGGKEQQDNIFISSPFGYEQNKLTDLNDKLKETLNTFSVNQKYNDQIKNFKNNFQLALGDTRRPVNEITLWDWSSIVAALYKSALAGALLGNKYEPNELKWRLLAIRVDSERILSDVSKIPAFLARKRWISEGLDRVKKLMEEEYPLGNEVYRDENGSVFTVPDIVDLLKIQDRDKSLKDLISEKLGFEGEIVATPSLSDPWWGQNPSGRPDPNQDKIPPIGKILEKAPYSPQDPKKVKDWWSEVNNSEVCTISWIRPQGPKEGASRKSSDYWAERIRGRAEDWYGNRCKTIWIDEVADENGRICLLTGKLDISGWLTPDGHVKTLIVKPPNGNTRQTVQIAPSFARLRRIWETTKTFWEDVEHDFEGVVGNSNKRLIIDGEIHSEAGGISKNNVYEIESNKARASVFYTDSGQLIIVENLERLARKMGYSKNDDDYIAYIQQELKDKEVRIFNPEGKNRNKHIGLIKTSKVEPVDDKFIPVIPILLEPILFMAIVPANKAIDIAKHIKTKYEIEMGKVRNRLPLSIGLTFAKSHTPLMALMDSGRKMINVSSKDEIWPLVDAKQCNDDHVLNFQNGVTWRIPQFMGDGRTEDEWYPYFYVDGTPINRKTAFQGPKGFLVHVSELKKGDAVKIEPSKFDFEFMDSASRRFEVTYDKNGKRCDSTKSQRPYLLDELDDFERIWKIISKKLATTQIKNIIGLIETKREEWNASKDDETFKRFVHDILRNANWKNGMPSNQDELAGLTVNGKLSDIIELYMDVLKVKGDENMGYKEVIE